MSDERDPPRLRDLGEGCDPVLRRVLDNAQRGVGDTAYADALATRIEHTLAANASNEARTRFLRRLMLGVGLAGIVAMWSTSTLFESAPSESAAPARHAAVPSAAAAEPRVQGVTHEGDARARSTAAGTAAVRVFSEAGVPRGASNGAVPHVERAVDVQARSEHAASQDAHAKQPTTPERASASRASRAKTWSGGREAPRSSAPGQTDVPPELLLLSSAQEALRTSPGNALALADEHARAYPAGRFAQEREAIAIDALVALGRSEAARERARSFLARYPRATQAARMRHLLEGAQR